MKHEEKEEWVKKQKCRKGRRKIIIITLDISIQKKMEEKRKEENDEKEEVYY